jgi:inhibitor of KinA sporulation pathway (predicted exonuclease)
MKSKAFYLVLDFEANCSGENTRDHEIIEFPAVLVKSDTHAIVDEFRTFVNLIKHKQLSEFIKQLTHITDEQVNNGLEWSKCLFEFELWCKKHGLSSANCSVATCGDWDLKTMLPNQLLLTKTKLSSYLKDLLCSWTNVKTAFSIAYAIKRLRRSS